jgi:hypothetical protein
MSSARYMPYRSSSVAQRLDALLGQLLGGTRGQLLAGLDDNLAAVGIDHVGGRLHALQRLGGERHAPAIAVALVDRWV